MKGVWCFLVVLALPGLTQSRDNSWGGLYPQESETREKKSLDGLWNFRLAALHDPGIGFREMWYSQPLQMTGPVEAMPVPSSYNDVTQNKTLRDHIGWAWYDRTFFVPERWLDDNQRVVLRLGSAHYTSIVFVNGEPVTSHRGGHLPIMADISSSLKYGEENLITITINNTLTPETIPQGKIVFKHDQTRYPEGYFVQTYNFDFVNYAGLHRPIYLYTTPQLYIDDIVVNTSVNGTTGIITYNITYNSSSKSLLQGAGCSVKLQDKLGNHVKSAIGCVGTILIEDAKLWWPYLMAEEPGYMYTMKTYLFAKDGSMDVYRQKVGIRLMGWDNTTLTMNGKPLYLRGCGKHEDADIRGKGVDYALIVKDFSLLKWLGANSFRTSHYPYAEEIMDRADEEGIMVIDESPAVGLEGFGDELLETHISVMQELVRRDKNRPSVIMWSVGNEPRSQVQAAKEYFRSVVNATKQADPTRPVTCVLSAPLSTEQAAYSLDVILVNRYFSWYSDTGHLEVIEQQTETEFTNWHKVHNRPVMISEYGAGSIAGIHMSPSFTWSEEYQVELMLKNFKAFNNLRSKGFFVGEMIWNFADFATPQGHTRVAGNKKGIFTRNRQPKMSAHLLRARYHSLANRTQAEGLIYFPNH